MQALEIDDVGWCKWIRQSIRGERDQVPELPGLGLRDIRVRLIDFYEGLPLPTRQHFEDGLVLALRSTPSRQANSSMLFVLLDIIGYCTPPDAKDLVRQRLFSGTLWGCTAPSSGKHIVNLQTVALAAAAAFGVDKVLADYVERSWDEASTFEFFLAGFRYVSRYRHRPALELVGQLLRRVETSADAQRIMLEVHASCEEHGYEEFLKWYLTVSAEMLLTTEQTWQLMQDALITTTIPWSAARYSYDSALRALAFLAGVRTGEVDNGQDFRDFYMSRPRISEAVLKEIEYLVFSGRPEFILIDPSDDRYGMAFKEPSRAPVGVYIGQDLVELNLTEASLPWDSRDNSQESGSER